MSNSFENIETVREWHLNQISNDANLICVQEEYAVAPNRVEIFVACCFINTSHLSLLR